MTFDASLCDCVKEEDSTRILAVVERHNSGVPGFNRYMIALATTIIELPSRMGMMPPSPSSRGMGSARASSMMLAGSSLGEMTLTEASSIMPASSFVEGRSNKNQRQYDECIRVGICGDFNAADGICKHMY